MSKSHSSSISGSSSSSSTPVRHTWTISTRSGVVASGESQDDVNATRCAKEAAARRGLVRFTFEVKPVRAAKKSKSKKAA